MDLKQYNFDQIAEYYDVLELPNSAKNREQNMFLFKILKKLGVKSILDISCGSGVQAVFLKKKGLNVVGVDPSEGLLEIARGKARRQRVDVDFSVGDMRTSVKGEFDCVISMYNSIGHVTHEEFKTQVLENIKKNLVNGGIYIFDIFNFDFLKNYEGPDAHDEEYHAPDGSKIYRHTINDVRPKEELVHVEHRNEILKPDGETIELSDSWDMQLYTIDFLEKVLEEAGFELLALYGSQAGDEFFQETSSSIYIVARKI